VSNHVADAILRVESALESGGTVCIEAAKALLDEVRHLQGKLEQRAEQVQNLEDHIRQQVTSSTEWNQGDGSSLAELDTARLTCTPADEVVQALEPQVHEPGDHEDSCWDRVGTFCDSLSCKQNFDVWWDQTAAWWAHTVCCFLGAPFVLKDIVPWMSPWQLCMGKISAKVLEARVHACAWPSHIQFICDNQFGLHILMPWMFVTKVFVFWMQYLIWQDQEGWKGTAQLVLKAGWLIYTFVQMCRVWRHRFKLAEKCRRDLRARPIPGVIADSSGTWVTPKKWYWSAVPQDADSIRCMYVQVDAIYNGIFRRHFCHCAQKSTDESRTFQVEMYTGWRDMWRSFWGCGSWRGPEVRVFLFLCLLVVFCVHLMDHSCKPSTCSSGVAELYTKVLPSLRGATFVQDR